MQMKPSEESQFGCGILAKCGERLFKDVLICQGWQRAAAR
jgi:hypothetical protein